MFKFNEKIQKQLFYIRLKTKIKRLQQNNPNKKNPALEKLIEIKKNIVKFWDPKKNNTNSICKELNKARSILGYHAVIATCKSLNNYISIYNDSCAYFCAEDRIMIENKILFLLKEEKKSINNIDIANIYKTIKNVYKNKPSSTSALLLMEHTVKSHPDSAILFTLTSYYYKNKKFHKSEQYEKKLRQIFYQNLNLTTGSIRNESYYSKWLTLKNKLQQNNISKQKSFIPKISLKNNCIIF